MFIVNEYIPLKQHQIMIIECIILKKVTRLYDIEAVSAKSFFI